MVKMPGFSVPPPLQWGDTVGLIAPSDYVKPEWINKSKLLLESWGLRVKLSTHLFARINDFAAGTAEERQADIRQMLLDPNVRAIWAVAGGYAAPDLLPFFTPSFLARLRETPKWFIGYSDVCILLNSLFCAGIASLHGANFAGFAGYSPKTHHQFRRLIQADGEVEFSAGGSELQREGHAEGVLLSSNLESLTVLFGTPHDPLAAGDEPIILGIEEWKAEKCNIVRQIDSILLHTKSQRIRGVLIGRFTHIHERSYPVWGSQKPVEEFIADRFARRGIPLAHLPYFGHIVEHKGFLKARRRIVPDEFFPLPNGAFANLTVASDGVRLHVSLAPHKAAASERKVA